MFRVNAVLASHVLSFLACLLGGCAPVFSDFQSAGTVGKEHIELTPAYASVFITEESYDERMETQHIQHNVGARLDVGLNNQLDLQLAGALLFSADQVREGESISPVRVVSVGPKVGLIPDILATAIPIGFASFPNANDLHWAVHPTLLLSYPFGQLEITNSAKVLIPLASGYETHLAFNWGAGWSRHSEQWKLRPEVGLMVNPGEAGLFWSAGIGFSYRIKGE